MLVFITEKTCIPLSRLCRKLFTVNITITSKYVSYPYGFEHGVDAYPYPPVYSGLKTCTELSDKLFVIQVVDLCAVRSGFRPSLRPFLETAINES